MKFIYVCIIFIISIYTSLAVAAQGYEVTDVTLRAHARVEDIRFIFFDPTQVLDHEREISIICKTLPKSRTTPQSMSDYSYFCFSSIEDWDVKVTNDSRIDCILDDHVSDVIHVNNPIRDHSCTINPVFAKAESSDRERMLNYLKGSNWICDHVDCMHNNITMYEILNHALHFDNSQFVLANQHPKIKLLLDLFHVIQEI